jgi:O-antigen ligase
VLNFSAKKWVKAVLLLTSLASIITIFSSGNRSGYVGVLLVLLMLMIGRKFFGVVLAFSIAIVVFAALSFTQSDHIAQERIERTFDEKMTTDVKRIDLLLYSIQIGLENPIIGVSPVGLRYELALRLGAHRAIADPHNVFASVIGGSGLICFSALVYIGWALCTPRKAKNVPDDEVPNFYLARRLSRMLVVLWVVRGMFTREILYNPSFCLAIGMCIGLCLESGGYLRKAKTLARQLAYPPLAA